MSFTRYFKLHRNKILAVGFSALALAFFFVYYGFEVGFNGFSFFTKNPFEFWNFLVVLIAYFTIFYCNITNDNAAYRGIAMFVFMIVCSQLLEFLPQFILSVQSILTMNPWVIVFSFFQLAFLIAQIVVGVLLYRYSRAYRIMIFDDFKKIRLYSILFASFLGANVVFWIVIEALSVSSLEPLTAAYFYTTLFALPLSDVLMAVSVIFTFERLRRD